MDRQSWVLRDHLIPLSLHRIFIVNRQDYCHEVVETSGVMGREHRSLQRMMTTMNKAPVGEAGTGTL